MPYRVARASELAPSQVRRLRVSLPMILEDIQKRKAQQRDYYLRNREEILAKKSAYKHANPEKVRLSNRRWHRKNKLRVYEKNLAAHHRRYRTDHLYRLAFLLRSRLSHAIRDGAKSGSAVRELGCNVDNLKQHLERQFLPGMTWDNHGNGAGEWNIDHVQPLASFDLTDSNQCRVACHFTNLQPLWAKDNRTKSDRILTNGMLQSRKRHRASGWGWPRFPGLV